MLVYQRVPALQLAPFPTTIEVPFSLQPLDGQVLGTGYNGEVGLKIFLMGFSTPQKMDV
jgi:hypothetical protein